MSATHAISVAIVHPPHPLGNLIGQFGETFVLQHPCNYEVKAHRCEFWVRSSWAPRARKMEARMLEQGQKDVLYYENMEGGHGGAAERAAAGTAPCVLLECVWWAVISGVSRRIYK